MGPELCKNSPPWQNFESFGPFFEGLISIRQNWTYFGKKIAIEEIGIPANGQNWKIINQSGHAGSSIQSSIQNVETLTTWNCKNVLAKKF